VILLVGCGFMIWRRRHRSIPRVESKAATAQSKQTEESAPLLVEALKEELFQLENDRLQRSVSREEYDAAKQAIEGTVKRALARAAVKS